MNRETKIGLLVGLAFIIVIGVLLSDHIQTSTQTRPAILGASGEVVRTGTAAPGTEHPGAAKVVPPARIEPPGQVSTADSLDAAAQSQQEIVIGPSVPMQPVAGNGMSGVTTTTGANGGQVAVGPMTDGVILTPPMGGTMNSVGNAVGPNSLMGADIKTPMPGDIAAKMEPLPMPGVAGLIGEGTAKTVISPPRTHMATAGDSVYKMTMKYYGGYSKSRAAMIIGANPIMGKNGSVVAGKQYVIPNLPGQAAPVPTEVAADVAPKPVVPPTVTPVQHQPTPTQVRPVVAQAPKAPAAPKGATYTVKSGDSLARIASKAGLSVAQLKAANKDVLKGSDTLQIGMTLKMPEKQMASAN